LSRFESREPIAPAKDAAKTAKIVVPNPAGSATDALARVLADWVAQADGITTIVENRPGAGKLSAANTSRMPRLMAARSSSTPRHS